MVVQLTNDILRYIVLQCDGPTLLKALCVSTIYGLLSRKDLATRLARQIGPSAYPTTIVPDDLLLCFLDEFTNTTEARGLRLGYAVEYAIRRDRLDAIMHLEDTHPTLWTVLSPERVLFCATEDNRVEIVRYLLTRGKNAPNDLEDLLCYALELGQMELVRMYDSAGAVMDPLVADRRDIAVDAGRWEGILFAFDGDVSEALVRGDIHNMSVDLVEELIAAGATRLDEALRQVIRLYYMWPKQAQPLITCLIRNGADRNSQIVQEQLAGCRQDLRTFIESV